MHVDLLRIVEGTPVSVTVPVRLEGVAPGTKMGGVLIQKLKEVKINCLPSKIPTAIILNVGELMIGDFVTIKKLKEISGFDILQTELETVVRLAAPRTVVETTDATEEAGEATDGEAAADGEASKEG